MKTGGILSRLTGDVETTLISFRASRRRTVFQLHRTGSGGGGEGSIMERKSVRKGRQPVPVREARGGSRATRPSRTPIASPSILSVKSITGILRYGPA